MTVDVKLGQFTDSIDHEQLQSVGVTTDLVEGSQGHNVPPHPARVTTTSLISMLYNNIITISMLYNIIIISMLYNIIMISMLYNIIITISMVYEITEHNMSLYLHGKSESYNHDVNVYQNYYKYINVIFNFIICLAQYTIDITHVINF